jgi:ABC-type lipoprotein release transport system permease subunit
VKDQLKNNLQEELKSAGASVSEISEFIGIASNLKQLKKPNNSLTKLVGFRQRQHGWRTSISIGLTSLGGIALGMAIIIFSQTVLPGSRLYFVQKLSDKVAVTLDSGYRGTVMMKRAQEVKQLVAVHASPNIVLATLAEYRIEASTYKSASNNYAVFEYCKSNLQQATIMATNPERQAINNALSSLKNV